MSKKYCLVRFIDDNVLYVALTKKITPIRDNLVWAPYKRMGYYEAIPLDYDDERSPLEKKKKDHANKQYGEQLFFFCYVKSVQERTDMVNLR